jgi:alpha-galactosidase
MKTPFLQLKSESSHARTGLCQSSPTLSITSRRSHRLGIWAGTAVALAGLILSAPVAKAAANGLGQTPVMGWNSWMVYGKSYTQAKVQSQADAMVAQVPGLPTGTTLQSLGYNYICMDSGWRDETGVDGNGFAKADTTKFPNGVPAIATYVHGKGLKLGIYLTPGMLKAAYDGNYPIAGTPYTTQQIVVTPLTNGNTENSTGASYSYQIDFTKPGATQWIQNYANMLASWGVDYVMWDFVGPGGGNIPADDRTNMQQWLTATQATPAGSRPIWIKLSNSLSFANASTWETVANSWRIDDDVHGTWADISNRMADSPQWAPFEGPGGWGDMDSLLVGTANFYASADERKSAATLWAICCSPFIIGQDLTALNSGDIPLITNPEVIAVDQAGHVAIPGQTAGVWRVKNPDGSYTVAIFNTGSSSATISCNFSNDLGFTGSATVRDLWSRTDLGTFSNSFSSGSLNSHGCRLLKVTGTSGGGTTLNFEAESLTYTPSGATASVQTDVNSSGGKWVQLSATATGQYINYSLPSVAAGTYQVQMEYKGNNTRGTLQLSVDGTNLGSTLDQYSAAQTYPTTTFGNVTFGSTGTHTIRLTVTGKNASSTGYGLSADKFVLVAQSGGGQVAAPTFSPAGGTYTSSQTVTITSSTSGASIRYTTDGSTPSETAGTIYSSPVSVATTTTLKAIAYKSGMTDSTVASAAYTINSGGGGTTVSFEAENLTYTPTGATASVQTDVNSSGGKWIVLSATATGQSISYAIPSVAAGTYQVQMEDKGNNTRGILQLAVDGTNLGSTLDQYSAAQTYPTTTFGTVTFSSAGTHTIKLTVTGKNASSSGYGLSADKFTFVAQ